MTPPRWVVVTVVWCAVVAAGAYGLMNARTVQAFGHLVSRVETTSPVVALTFDDGPTARAADVIAVLDRLDVHATFFVTGRELAEHPEAGRDLVLAGHELGNHSWSHDRMVLMSRARIAEEIERTDAQIRAVGHTGPIHFRPPYGKKLFGLPAHLSREGRTTVMWDIEPDSDPALAPDPVALVEHVVDTVEPGSIILLHVMYEANEPSLQAMPELVERLRADGYEFLTVSELLAAGD